MDSVGLRPSGWILFIKECYYKESNCNVSNFLDLTIIIDNSWTVVRHSSGILQDLTKKVNIGF